MQYRCVYKRRDEKDPKKWVRFTVVENRHFVSAFLKYLEGQEVYQLVSVTPDT